MMSDKTRQILTDVEYPAKKKEILDMAKKEGIDQKEMDMLQKLPEKEYSDLSEVTDELEKTGSQM